MNALFRLDDVALWHVTGWTMVHTPWLGTVVALVAGTARLVLGRATPNARYLLSVGTLAVLAVLPMLIASWLTIKTAPAHRAAAGPLITPNAVDPAAIGERQRVERMDFRVQPVEPGDDKIGLDAPVPPEFTASSGLPDIAAGVAMSARPIYALDACVRYLPWLWLAGTPITFALLATGVIGTRRLRRTSRAIDEGPMVELLARLVASLRIGRRVSLAVCERIAAPVLVGILRPAILLPPAALTGWSPDEIEMVLLHELAHVRRWDNAVNLAQRIVESLLFFHPAVWLVSSWIRREREACCDAVVVRRTNRPHAYAELLVALAAQMPRSVLFHPAASSAMAAGPLKKRIRRILQLEDDPMLVSGKSFVIALASVLVAATLAVLYLPKIGQAEESAAEATLSPEEKASELETKQEAAEETETTTENTESTETNHEAAERDSETVELSAGQLEITSPERKVQIEADDEPGRLRIRTKETTADAGAPSNQVNEQIVFVAYLLPKESLQEAEKWAELMKVRGVSDSQGRFMMQAPADVHRRFQELLKATAAWRKPGAAEQREQNSLNMSNENGEPRLHWRTIGLTLGASREVEVSRMRPGRFVGLEVVAVDPGSPAAWLTVQPGDMLVSISDFKTPSLGDVKTMIQTMFDRSTRTRHGIAFVRPKGEYVRAYLPEANKTTGGKWSAAAASQIEIENGQVRMKDVHGIWNSGKQDQRGGVSDNAQVRLSTGAAKPLETQAEAHAKPARRSATLTEQEPGGPVAANQGGSNQIGNAAETNRWDPATDLLIERIRKLQHKAGEIEQQLSQLETEFTTAKRRLEEVLKSSDPQKGSPELQQLEKDYDLATSSLKKQLAEINASMQGAIKALHGRLQRPVDEERRAAELSQKRKFPTLEEQKLVDLAYKRLGLELEPIDQADLERVKALGYEGGVKVAAAAGTPGQVFQAGDILVGLHVWPTTTLKQVAEVLTRDDLAELNPLKFYVVRQGYDEASMGQGPRNAKTVDVITTGRVSVNLPGGGFGGGKSGGGTPSTAPASRAIVPSSRPSDSKPAPESSGRTIVVPSNPAEKPAAKPQPVTHPNPENLRYEGKTFDEWRGAWQTELSTEKRLEAVKALAAFGRAGYGKEAAEAILDVAGQYDFSVIQNDAEGKLKNTILNELAPDSPRRSMAEYWLPELTARLQKEPKKWRWLVSNLLTRLRTDDERIIDILHQLAKNGPAEIRLDALSALVSSSRFRTSDTQLDDKTREALGTALQSADLQTVNRALGLLLDYSRTGRGGMVGQPPPQLAFQPELLPLLFHPGEDIRRHARGVLRYIDEKDAPQVVEQLVGVLHDESRKADRIDAIRALAAMGGRAKAAIPDLRELLNPSADPDALVATTVALARINSVKSPNEDLQPHKLMERWESELRELPEQEKSALRTKLPAPATDLINALTMENEKLFPPKSQTIGGGVGVF